MRRGERDERRERQFRLWFFAAVAFEGLFLATFVLVADLSNRMQLLLLLATVGSYTLVVLSLVTLGVYVNRGLARILKAVELLNHSFNKAE